jgi:5-methylthioribose kinase
MVAVMEFLEGHTLLDHVLVDSNLSTMDPAIAAGLGEFMGKVHAATHSSTLSTEQKQAYVTEYENREMRDVQLEFVFTKCYKEATDEQRAGLNVTPEFLQEIELLKQQYNGQSNSLVLSHGDLHPGSVMVDPTTGSVKVIDPEFTVYGPPGLDVGSLLSGYCLGAIHQAFSSDTNPQAATAVDSIIAACHAIWESYVTALKSGGITDAALLKSMEVETVGFTVAEVCRTAMEFAGGRKWLQFENSATRAASKKAALQLVDQCMIARHEGGMALLLERLKAVATTAVQP